MQGFILVAWISEKIHVGPPVHSRPSGRRHAAKRGTTRGRPSIISVCLSAEHAPIRGIWGSSLMGKAAQRKMIVVLPVKLASSSRDVCGFETRLPHNRRQTKTKELKTSSTPIQILAGKEQLRRRGCFCYDKMVDAIDIPPYNISTHLKLSYHVVI